MEEVRASHLFFRFVETRAGILAAQAVRRSLAGKEPAAQPCRACGATAACRPYEFKVRRHLRMAERGGLGANTTWIMAKHDELLPGSGAVCAQCMESFLRPHFGRVMKILLIVGLGLCLPLPALLLIEHRPLHEMGNGAFVAVCVTAVLCGLGLGCLALARFVDYFLSHKFDRTILGRMAALERAPLRERFPAETYALQIGLRFSDLPAKAGGEEIVSCDDDIELSRGVAAK